MGSCGFCSIFAGCHAKLRHSLPLGLRSFSEILVLCGTDWGLWDDDMPISICTFYISSNGSYTVHTLPPVFVGAMPSSEPLCIICWLVPGLVQNVFIVRRGKKLQETPCLMEEPMVSCRFPSPTRRTTPPRCRLHGGHGHAVSHMFCQAPAAAAAAGSDQGIARHLMGF